MNTPTHTRSLHCSVNTEETFISGSNHICDNRRGSVFPATALSSQMISVFYLRAAERLFNSAFRTRALKINLITKKTLSLIIFKVMLGYSFNHRRKYQLI